MDHCATAQAQVLAASVQATMICPLNHMMNSPFPTENYLLSCHDTAKPTRI
jgi:hypothetical protein